MRSDIIRNMNRKSTVLVPGSLFPMEDVLIFKHSSFLRHQPKPPRVSLCSLSKWPSSSLVCCGDAPPLAFSSRFPPAQAFSSPKTKNPSDLFPSSSPHGFWYYSLWSCLLWRSGGLPFSWHDCLFCGDSKGLL